MKVALIGPVYPYRGGIAHYTTLLAQALRGRGHEVLLVSFSRQYPQWLYPGKSDRDPSQQGIQTEAEFILDPLSPFLLEANQAENLRIRPPASRDQLVDHVLGASLCQSGGPAEKKRIPGDLPDSQCDAPRAKTLGSLAGAARAASWQRFHRSKRRRASAPARPAAAST